MVPEVEYGISYAMPACFYKGKPLISFLVTKKHLSIYPFSSRVVEEMRDKLDGFSVSPGTIRFSVEKPLPDKIMGEIIQRRMRQIEEKAGLWVVLVRFLYISKSLKYEPWTVSIFEL